MMIDYFKERLGVEAIEKDAGFLIYKILGPECFIQDFYVKPPLRGKGVGSEMVKELESLAKTKGCSFLTASVHAPAKNSTDSLKVVLAMGGELVGVSGQDIFFKKNLFKEEEV